MPSQLTCCGFESRPPHDMSKENERGLDEALAEVITGQPHELSIGRKTVRLYPVTLAKTFVLRRWMESLGIDASLLKVNPYVECLRLAGTEREKVSEILAVHSAPNTQKDLHDSRSRAMRRNLFASVKTEHLAGLLMAVLTQDRTEELMGHLGLVAEHERLMEVLKVKRDGGKNNLSFGGKSIFGAFIGQLKELGYTDDEILFERGYSYLRLMLADKVTSVYLSDDELSKLPQSAGGTLLDGDDEGDLAALERMIKQGGVKPAADAAGVVAAGSR